MAEINDRVGEYVLLEEIGAGAFGRVFKARHHLWPDQIVAVKIPTNPDYVRLLKREGLAMHRVAHPNIVRVLACDPYADPPYLVTEYVGGGDLGQLLKSGPLPIDRAVEIFEQMLRGLAAAHAAGIVHLDLKPANILLDTDGTAKLTDFGLGRAVTWSEESIAQSMSLARDAAAITGTWHYMSPEQRDGREVDHRADLYAAGIILFEMLTGSRPSGRERPSDLRPEVPDWLDAVFVCSYARLQWRYNSAEAMLEDVRKGRILQSPESRMANGSQGQKPGNRAAEASDLQHQAGALEAAKRPFKAGLAHEIEDDWRTRPEAFSAAIEGQIGSVFEGPTCPAPAEMVESPLTEEPMVASSAPWHMMERAATNADSSIARWVVAAWIAIITCGVIYVLAEFVGC